MDHNKIARKIFAFRINTYKNNYNSNIQYLKYNNALNIRKQSINKETNKNFMS